MSKVSKIVQIGVFCLFILLFFVANLITRDKTFSERENRMLASPPSFSFEKLRSGDFTQDYEKYITDQFFLRDNWTTLKARCETLAGKRENNGVYLCGGGTLITRFENPDETRLESNVGFVNALVKNAGDIPVYFELIPGAASIWADKLPANAPNEDQLEYIAEAYSSSDARTVDVAAALTAHSGEDIFYRTDHHWTSLGAYYGYTALMETMGIHPRPLESYSRETVTEEFYGTAYSSSGFSWVKPDSIEIFVQETDAERVNYGNGNPQPGALYDYDKLSVKDKYSFFMGGNTSLITIKTGIEEAPSLLILLEHFSEIHIIDLRYYKTSIADYIAQNDIDSILVSYSISNFATDTNLFLLSR